MTRSIARIRVASEKNIDDLVTLITAFRDHLGQNFPNKAEIFISLKRLIAEDTVEFLIAYDGNNVAIGYTQTRYFYSLWSTGLEAQIEDLFLLSFVRGRGLGSQLVQCVIDRARERNCCLLVLNTNEYNTNALRLYTKMGFAAERSRWQGGRQQIGRAHV